MATMPRIPATDPPTPPASGYSAGARVRRIGMYMSERTQPKMIAGFLILYATSVLYGKAIAGPGALTIGARDILAAVGFISFFVLARVFDEHKDYEFDVVHLPDRPLPRGAITWREVDGLGAAAFAVQVIVCLAVDGGIGPVCAWWAIAIAYLVLTRYEFFVRPWLRRHFLINTITHLPVYALASIWAAQIGARPDWVGPRVAWLAAFAYVTMFGLDIWRKSHAPQEERAEVDSYTGRWGVTGACTRAALLTGLSAALAGALVAAAPARAAAAYVVFGVLALPAWLGLWRFARDPGRATVAQARDLLAGSLIGIQLTIGATVILERGLA